MIGTVAKLVWRGIADMRLHPGAQFLTLVAVTLVSLLAGVFMLAMHNVNLQLLETRGEAQFLIFWKPGADMAEVKGQWDELRSIEGLAELRTFTPDEALEDLSASLGESADVSGLKGDNPLPPTAQAYFSVPPDRQGKGWANELLGRFRAMPGVDEVHFNPLQMELAETWLSISNRVVWPIIGFLGLVVALILGNTIKLSLLTRRDEVEILHLVGAREWYIRLPLLAAGAVQGLLGSLISLGLLKALQLSVRDMLDFPPLMVTIHFIPLDQAATLAGAVTLVGIISSWVAVRS